MKKLVLVTVFSLVMSVVFRAGIEAQSTKAAPDELFKTVAALDASLFQAYNTCDLTKLGSMVSNDLEFYHDKTGLAVGRATFLDSIQKYICGKVHRELVTSSLEVHPLQGYGAVEIGTHRFSHPGSGETDSEGEAKFVMLWQNRNGAWTLTRVISYDHDVATK